MVNQTSSTLGWGKWSREQRERMRSNLKWSDFYIEVAQVKEQGCQLIITPSESHAAPNIPRNPASLMLHILLSGWRNLASGMHFQHLGVSLEEARQLHQQAGFKEVLEPLSRIAWKYMTPVEARKYYELRPTGESGNRQWASGGVIVFVSPQKREYGLLRRGDSFAVARAAREWLSEAYQVEAPTSRCWLENEQEWAITYQQTGFVDYLREGMVWEHFSQGSLCPACGAIESGRELSRKRDYKKIVATQYEDKGLVVNITLYECQICQVRWEVNASRNYWDYGYP